ncbi:P-type DNA transfer ATPase VirB11 [Aggregatibacter actinomycetemcomitans]|uniref:P-type DNA transfer ATPase VirB11 n=1 Tax=Aggregatibacter actinomycetemcomitans TaxID=714 RepID=UPI00197BCEA4|nr:P-type DNA transfer ATPase VirB11 [Aggregatibacter actinomycetemcomitans]MBN6059381.1 P-type DNA transfer ATPase VirB11 [Aggregatibacter actinomycetemcomitans]MBN6087882.1 P-type DNA transfer ATPase VirB11 [Aggregatibacter actinomycetemcomitans]
MTSQATSLEIHTKRLFGTLLDDEQITEIAINRPGEIFFEKCGKWQKEKAEQITFSLCESFAKALAKFRNDDINEIKPVLSAVLPTGERVQVVFPPACERDTISITVRKPNKSFFDLPYYINNGFFDRVIQSENKLSENDEQLLQMFQAKKYSDFLSQAVTLGKNIIIAGETGSGKTTLMKSLVDFIPLEERLATIEDTPELFFRQHENYVHLFYPSEAKTGDLITAASLLKSCLRMKPDRILLAELRSGETYDFINVVSSGHNGSITSCHAGSVAETWERLILMTLQNDQGRTLSYNVIRRLLQQTIDIIVHVTNSYQHGRHMTEIYFDPNSKLQALKAGKNE